MESIQIGQRFISDMEPELGLGIIIAVNHRTVDVHFRAGECKRQYAIRSAPLRRVSFHPGDVVKTRAGVQFTIERTDNRNGLLVYVGNGQEIPEQELCDTLSFTSPKDRLLSGFFDSHYMFDIRFNTVKFYSALRHSPVHGFQGGRIQLIPHQLYIAHEVARRSIPRVMLSDEVGLGKTIEACLILHRLLLTGRINRVLILVPETLIYQWFVELARKFSLIVRIMDNDYYSSIRDADPKANPFLKDQLCLCDIQFPGNNESCWQHAMAAGWDILVIDEAHHLTENSESYKVVKSISAATPGLMLLTATPEQLGHRSHFARLQLLDPDRYHDYQAFVKEQTQYKKIARLTDKLLTDKKLTSTEQQTLDVLLPVQKNQQDRSLRQNLITELLDRHGTGRVMFRNTRAGKIGFPKRDVHLIPLQLDNEHHAHMAEEFRIDLQQNSDTFSYDFSQDPRIQWLVQLLKTQKHAKVVLICSCRNKVIAIDIALRKHMRIHTALFYEDLTLLQRDRNAAWFARKDGAPVLICSEIGSEGRNFQFAQHLVLFDLPMDPEKLEQRIGRLDRIGQTATIHLYIPYLQASPQEILVRWYHEGLDAFHKNLRGAFDVYQTLGPEIREITMNNRDCEAFLLKTQRVYHEISQIIEKGRDKLLELHSHHPETSAALIQTITAQDQDKQLDRFTALLFNLFGIQMDEVHDRTCQINFDLLDNPTFPVPLLREENLIATFDRNTAIQREDIEFLTWDHPMITGAMELLMASEKGNCCIALLPEADSDEILLEAVFIVECVSPPRLHIDRFLPPTPVRMVVNHLLKDRRENWLENQSDRHLKNVTSSFLLQNAAVKSLIPEMITQCQEFALKSAAVIIENGLNVMEQELQTEINRLLQLKKVNPGIRDEEILVMQQERSALHTAISSARLRLDALRLIFKTKNLLQD